MAEEAVLHGVETPVVPGIAEVGERIYVASQWQLMWWRFRKHHLAMAAGIVVVCFYLVAIFADFLATTDPELSDAKRSLMPPQRLHWFDGWSLQPHVYGVKGAREAGNVGALPAVANALVDALSPLGIRHIAMPATPERIWHAIKQAKV